jgi:DNA-binding response OmpR family regulator
MRSPIRVLVVDDPIEASDVARTLDAAGYVAACCPDPDCALRCVVTFRPDAIVSEMHVLREGDGVGVGRRLQGEGDSVLVFVSHDADSATRMAAFDAGADDYLVKPYEPAELVARLQAHLRRAGRLASHVTQVGPLVVDESAHRAVVDGVPVEVRPTDFALLAALARHAGQVLSKRRLLEMVWGYEALDENRVEVHVSLLRRQVGPAAAPLIQTVRGVGYVLRADQRNGGEGA